MSLQDIKFNEYCARLGVVLDGRKQISYPVGWMECKVEILKLLEQNQELESISQNGRKVYKIYGTVIEKIKEL